MLKQKLLIIQQFVPHYRLPFFNMLSDKFDLTLLHSGAEVADSEIGFKQIVLRKQSIRSIYRYKHLHRHTKNFDVVVTIFDLHCLASIEATIACKLCSIPVVLWGHGMGQAKMSIPLRVFWTKIASALVLYDYGRMQPFLENGIPRIKIFECPNTVHISNYGFSPETKKTRFLFIGRTMSRKNIAQLIRGFSNLDKHKVKNITLDIVGEGDELKNLKALANSSPNSGKIIFHGKVTDDEVLKELFHSSLAYVCPGLMGLAILHSFAYGVPVITTNYYHHSPEIHNLNDNNSWIYDSSDMALTNLMSHLISNPSEAIAKGKNAFHYYTSSRTITQMVDGMCDAIRYSSADSQLE